MTDQWINSDDASHMASYGADSNLVDAAASGGGIVLPFSYSGATLSAGPVFNVKAYSSSTVANTSPAKAADLMNAEIASIHYQWPQARIVVVGHSDGGLVAEQWWLNFGAHNPRGVTQVFALDSPLNGAKNCTSPVYSFLCGVGGVGNTLANYLLKLWKNQSANDAVAVALDNRDKLFTAIGTDGDPVYDAADYSLNGKIGTVSQFFYPASCAGTAYTASCIPIGPPGHWYVNPCGPFDDGSPLNYGLPFDGWIHSVVKNCAIGKVMQYVR
jgi:hypothetical protein